MIKNLSILVLGILIGMGAMFLVQLYQDLQEENSSLRQSVGEGQAYDQSEGEKVKAPAKHWFEEKVTQLDEDTQDKIDEMNAEGEEAAKLFEQFSKPEKKEN